MWFENTSMCLAGILLTVAGLCSAAVDQNCEPYTRRELSEQCDEQRAGDWYKDLSVSLADAVTWEQTAVWAMNITLEIYKFIHPCASNAEAALVLFYEHDIPHHHAAYWVLPQIAETNQPFIGRRRRQETPHFHTDTEMLIYKLEAIRKAAGATCVQELMYPNKDILTQYWKQQYPDFITPPPDANQNTQQVTTHTIASTTTAKPTTPSTHATTTTTAKPVSVATTATLTSFQCFSCMGLDCLIKLDIVKSCPSNTPVCYTNVTEMANSERFIVRGCAAQSSCQVPNAECQNVESNHLGEGRSCVFCCNGDICNKPPVLMPSSARYPPW